MGSQLVNRLSIIIDGKEPYSNTGERIFEVYRDLWLPDEKRECIKEFVVNNENIRKVMSKDDSPVASKKADDGLMSNVYSELKIPLGKVLKNSGLFAPYSLVGRVIEYSITLPKTAYIMKVQSS